MRMLPFVLVMLSLSACGGLLGFGDDDAPPPRPSQEAASPPVDDATSNPDVAASDASGDVDAAEAAPPVKKHVFVSRATFSGGFGSRAGADRACTAAATAAGRGGTWKAYLADLDGIHPSTRVEAREWFLYDGRRVFPTRPPTDAGPEAGIVVDETGAFWDSGTKFVWTGLANAVGAGDRTCAGWTADAGTSFGGYGDIFGPSNEWQQSAGTVGCDEMYRLYCFED